MERIDEAVEFADESDFPPESIYDHVYVPTRSGSYRRRALRGRAQATRSADGRARYREALNAALREELERDERVLIIGEDIGVFNGAFKVTAGLLEEFGDKRVRDTPISENTIVGVGVGAAMTGLRPVVELMTINFSLLAMDQIVNHMATIHYMFGGQATVPMVVRMPQGAGHQLGPTHSHCLEAISCTCPDPARRPLHAGRRQGPAEGRDPRRQPGRLHRARVALRRARARSPTTRITSSTSAGRDPPRGRRRDDRRHLAHGDHRAEGGRGPRGGARPLGRGDRPAHAAPARPRHDPRVGPQDQPRA